MAKYKELPTLSRLNELFTADSINGLLIRKVWVSGVKSTDVGKPCGCPNKVYGYLSVNIDGTGYKVHRILWSMYKGKLVKPTEQVDHKDLNRHNNCESNLRLVSALGNAINHSKQRNNTSGYTGVFYIKQHDTFFGRVRYKGKYYRVPRNKDPAVVNAALIKLRTKLKFGKSHGKKKEICYG